MRFVLKIEIEISNDAMLTRSDMNDILREVCRAATKKRYHSEDGVMDYDRRGDIQDVNGNTVGSWEASEK